MSIASQQMPSIPQQMPSIPLVVLSGFLGSGKTTLLNRVLADASMHDTAVIVNEFGEIGIDHLLVESVADDVVLLASGCVCCSAGDDLGAALASMLGRRGAGALPPFRRIVLETTGIADPGSVLQRLLSDAAIAARIRIEAVVTVVDAVFGEAAMSRHPECASQVAMANRLVISKLDLTARSSVDSLLDCLRSVNPAAPIILSGRHEPAADNLLFGDADARLADVRLADVRLADVRLADVRLADTRLADTRLADTRLADVRLADVRLADDAIASLTCRPVHRRAAPDHANRYSTYRLSWEEPADWRDFKAWLEGLLIARGDSILRMKGVLQVAGRARPVVVQGVQHALYPPKELARWPYAAPRSELVFVTRDFPREAALRSFQQLFPYLSVA